jgi:hypothetical protein
MPKQKKIQRKIQICKFLLIANELKLMILYSCENIQDMLNLAKSCQMMYRLYFLIVNDPRHYIFYQTKYNSPIPRIIEFKKIQRKRKNTYVVFDAKYSRCVECKKENLYCDTNTICRNCTVKNIQCEKKESEKRLFFKKQERYCHSINYHTSFTKLIMEHKSKVEKIGKRICDKCREFDFCDNYSKVLSNCCNVNFCPNSNVNHLTLNLYGPTFTNYYHFHQLCEVCYNSIGKTTPLTLYNNYTFSPQ